MQDSEELATHGLRAAVHMRRVCGESNATRLKCADRETSFVGSLKVSLLAKILRTLQNISDARRGQGGLFGMPWPFAVCKCTQASTNNYCDVVRGKARVATSVLHVKIRGKKARAHKC